MNWEAIGAIGDFMGGVGVIVTLGYLALQIRTNTNVMRSNAQREMNSNVNDRFFSSREVLEAHVKVKSKDGHEEVSVALMNEYDLTPEQAVSYWRYILQIWKGLEADFKMGVVDEDAIATFMRANDMRLCWDATQFWIDPSFAKLVQSIAARHPS
jgi:hypothetical protein